MADRLESLPTFTCIDYGEQRVNLWPDPGIKNYGEANAAGRARAEELVRVIRTTRSTVLLGNVIEAINASGRFGGLEIGFFHALSIELMNPETTTEFVTVAPEREFRLSRKLGCLGLVESSAA